MANNLHLIGKKKKIDKFKYNTRYVYIQMYEIHSKLTKETLKKNYCVDCGNNLDLFSFISFSNKTYCIGTHNSFTELYILQERVKYLEI